MGLLDFGLRHGKLNSLRVVEDLLDYAGRADQLGFSRFWIAASRSTSHAPTKLAWRPIMPRLHPICSN